MESSQTPISIDIERREGSKAAVTVTVSAGFVQQKYNERMRQAARKVTIPGFRPGKAPMSMLADYLDAKSIFSHAVDDVINDTYKIALADANLEPLERGEIDDVKTGEDMTLTYVVIVAVRPEIKLPEYTGIVVRHAPTVLTDDMVNHEIERMLDRSADYVELVDEGINDNDYVTVDYTMEVDGAEYPEGSTTGYPLEVGSDTFFPELNAALLGAKRGDVVVVDMSYPEDYGNADIAGKAAKFTVTIQQVRRRTKPEATDAWATAATGGAVANLDALRDRIRENLAQYAERADRDHVRNEIVRQIVEGAAIDLPDTLVDEEYEHLMSELEHRLSHERMNLELYAEVTNRTVEQIEREQNLLARDLVRRQLVLGEIARQEEITVTDDDIDAALTMEAYVQGISESKDVLRKVKELRREYQRDGRLDNLAGRIHFQKVLGFLQESATVIAEAVPEGEVAPPAEGESEA